MRDVFALPSPQPSGWGISLFKRVIAVAAVAATVVAGAAPARAATVTVRLRLSAGAYTAAFKTCAVSVPSGATGVGVLSAAVSGGCIAGYTVTNAGQYLTCVDPGAASICEIGGGLVTFWAVYDNGVPSDGIGVFRASAGRELGLSYTNFATCPTYPDCPL